VLAGVYNEEERIEGFLRSFAWSDDIIIIDKSSTDRTRDIIQAHKANLITVPYTDDAARLGYLGIEQAKNEWVFMVTASDLIHPALARRLLELINQDEFPYDVIRMPYAMYVFGIKDRRSPWYSKWEQKLARKSAISFADRVHEERGVTSTRVFAMDPDEVEILYHLTHRNLDTFFEHHLRYCKLETRKYDFPESLREIRKEIWAACKLVFIRRKTYRIKDNGWALGLAYISYFIMKYLFVWQKFYGRGEETYQRIRETLESEAESRIP
jgi:glycosyltransferase involved in cell wall biosynthesis